jgi:GNAT superfamily N-acetyltransferase
MTSEITYRAVCDEGDIAFPFVYAALRDSYRAARKDLASRDYYHVVCPKLIELLKDVKTTVLVAEFVDPELADEFAGFIVYKEPEDLYYVYTKKVYRGLGIGKGLMERAFGDAPTGVYCRLASKDKIFLAYAKAHGWSYEPLLRPIARRFRKVEIADVAQ